MNTLAVASPFNCEDLVTRLFIVLSKEEKEKMTRNYDEKHPETEEDLPEHRTDGTDAFDTLYIAAEKFPQYELFSVFSGGYL